MVEVQTDRTARGRWTPSTSRPPCTINEPYNAIPGAAASSRYYQAFDAGDLRLTAPSTMLAVINGEVDNGWYARAPQYECEPSPLDQVRGSYVIVKGSIGRIQLESGRTSYLFHSLIAFVIAIRLSPSHPISPPR